MNRAIVVDELVKTYRNGQRAVDNVTFSVAAGQVFGFLGPNGAGKSTTVRILTTLSLPSGGRATVGGFDVARQPAEVRRVAGVALQEVGIDPLMTARELLVLQCRLFGMARPQASRRAEELLGIVALAEAAGRPAGTYSGGMRRRLDLALALAHQPAILFLDEPTTGLDPASRRAVWAEVRRLNRDAGTTIFLTTQYLEEADQLADQVAIINQGRLVAAGAPEQLKAALGAESMALTFGDERGALMAEAQLAALAPRTQRDRHTLRLYLPEAARAVPAVVGRLATADIQPIALTLTRPTLDDVFLQVTGQQYEAGAPAA